MELQCLVYDLLKDMEAAGYHTNYISSTRRTLAGFLSYANQMGCTEFTSELAYSYLALFPDDPHDRQKHESFLEQSRCLRRLENVSIHGKVAIDRLRHPHDDHIAPAFLTALSKYDVREQESGLSQASLTKNRRPILYLLEYFTEMGYTQFADIQHGDTVKAVDRMLSEHYTPSGLCTAISGMRRFYQMFSELQPYSLEIPARLIRTVNIIDVYTLEEQLKIREYLLHPQDTSYRDVAICFLAFETGIRNVDICGLKKSDVEWEHNRINIVQSKTKRPLSLPLRSTYGNAMVNYLLHERPASDSEYFFLTTASPHRKLTSTWAIIKAVLERAGIDIDNRLAGTRMFRHNAASTMLNNGVPIGNIKEELGHSHADSTMRYISTDKKKMQLLTLPCPKGGVMA